MLVRLLLSGVARSRVKRYEPLTVIALHGVALSIEEIEEAAQFVMGHIDFPEIRWVIPKADSRPVSILHGHRALALYDIRAHDRTRMDEAGVEAATKKVQEIVRSERQRSPAPGKVVLLGFSQGGALALHAGLGLLGEVDGIVALATALPFPDRVPEASRLSPPLFLGHGFLDTQVSYALGRETWRLLSAKGYETEWHTYAQGHTTGSRQLHDISRWLDHHFVSRRSIPELVSIRMSQSSGRESHA